MNSREQYYVMLTVRVARRKGVS